MEIGLWILGISFGLWAVKSMFFSPAPDAHTQTSRVTSVQMSPQELKQKRDERDRQHHRDLDERQRRRDLEDDSEFIGVGAVAYMGSGDDEWERRDPTPVRDDSIVAPSAEVSPAPVSARVEAYEPPTRSEPVYEAPSQSYDSSPSYDSSSSDSGSSYSSDSGGSSDSGSSSSFD